jgi:hypothetical protein
MNKVIQRGECAGRCDLEDRATADLTTSMGFASIRVGAVKASVGAENQAGPRTRAINAIREFVQGGKSSVGGIL